MSDTAKVLRILNSYTMPSGIHYVKVEEDGGGAVLVMVRGSRNGKTLSEFNESYPSMETDPRRIKALAEVKLAAKEKRA